MEGGFFLIQHVDFVQGGRRIKGMEAIGHLQPFGEEPSRDITEVRSAKMATPIPAPGCFPGGGGYESTIPSV